MKPIGPVAFHFKQDSVIALKAQMKLLTQLGDTSLKLVGGKM